MKKSTRQSISLILVLAGLASFYRTSLGHQAVALVVTQPWPLMILSGLLIVSVYAIPAWILVEMGLDWLGKRSH